MYFQPEDNHETRIAESEKFLKITGPNTSWKLLFFFIFYSKQAWGWNIREKRWGN